MKEKSLNSDDQPFPQYQQNVQSPLILSHWTHKKHTTYDVRDPCHGLGQTQNCGGVKPVNMIPPLFITGSLTAVH
jgi:hypothetical protein